MVTRGASGQAIRYLPSDHLGSVAAIIDQQGTALAKLSFAAFGGRRGSSWSGAPSSGEMTQIASATRAGYTGHERLDNLELIHMNGRVYDPKIGRFMSRDPLVADLQNGQDLNGYAYVRNGPMRYTDPTGWETAPTAPIKADDPSGAEQQPARLPPVRVTGQRPPERDPERWRYDPLGDKERLIAELNRHAGRSSSNSDPGRTGAGQSGTKEGEDDSEDTPDICISMAEGTIILDFFRDTASTFIGMADAVSFGGYGSLVASVGLGEPAHTPAYNAGLYGGMFVSGSRLAYASTAYSIQFAKGMSYVDAVNARNSLKGAFSWMGSGHPRVHSPSQMLAKYGSESAAINAASRTDWGINAAAAAVAASSIGQLSESPCP